MILALVWLAICGAAGGDSREFESEPGRGWVFRSPKHLHTYEVSTTLSSVLIEVEGGERGEVVLCEFDKTFSLRETFNEDGLARIYAEGVFVGSHFVTLKRGGGGEVVQSVFFDLVWRGGAGGLQEVVEMEVKQEAIEVDIEQKEQEVTQYVGGGGESSPMADGTPRVVFVDTVPTNSIDGQRAVWISQIEMGDTSLASAFQYEYIFVGDWSKDSVVVQAVEEVGGIPKFVMGQLVDSDEDAEVINQMFKKVKAFEELKDEILIEAFGGLCEAVRGGDVGVVMMHQELRNIHDHYVVELMRICGCKKVVVELPLMPTKIVLSVSPDLFVAPSDFVRREYWRLGGKGIVEVVNPGVEIVADGSEVGEVRKRGSGKIVQIAAVMRLDPDKNPLLLLKGLSHVANVCERVNVKVAGDGKLKEDLSKAANSLGLTCVEFLGPQNKTEVDELLKTSEIFVNPSTYNLQTWGIANLEAMARGLAVVAFNVGGTADYLLNDMNCLVPKFSGEGIGEAIELLLIDTTLRTRLGRAARATAKGHSATRMRERYQYIYTRRRRGVGMMEES